MSQDFSINLILPRLLEGQAQMADTNNSLVNFMDFLVHCAIVNRVATSPPDGVAIGSVWLVGSSATGVWLDQDGKLAAWYGAWKFTTVRPGFVIWDKAADEYFIYDGTVWKSIVVETVREKFALVDGAGTVEILANKWTDYDGAADQNPDYPLSLLFVLINSGGSTDVDIVITGILANGTASTEELNFTGGNGSLESDKAWATISNISIVGGGGADFDSGFIQTVNGEKLGLQHKNAVSVYKEIVDGVNEAVGTFNNTYKTYIPTGLIDVQKSLEVWYRTAQFVG